jgi:hypothetical protein
MTRTRHSPRSRDSTARRCNGIIKLPPTTARPPLHHSLPILTDPYTTYLFVPPVSTSLRRSAIPRSSSHLSSVATLLLTYSPPHADCTDHRTAMHCGTSFVVSAAAGGGVPLPPLTPLSACCTRSRRVYPLPPCAELLAAPPSPASLGRGDSLAFARSPTFTDPLATSPLLTPSNSHPASRE